MSYVHLSEAERNVIFRMAVQGQSSSLIALAMGRSPSTISRELRRNVEADGRYFPSSAQVFANARGRAHVRRPRTGNQRLMDHVTEHLERRWSPQQVAGRLRELPPTGLAGVTISHQTIYRWIWSDLQRSQRFKPFLRVACRKRRKPYGKPSRRGQIPNRVSIEQRPAEVEQRGRLGDWEGDTIVGKARSGYVAAGVERASRYLVARKLTACTAQAMKSKLH